MYLISPPFKLQMVVFQSREKLCHLANSMRSAMNQSAWTFQLYCKILAEEYLHLKCIVEFVSEWVEYHTFSECVSFLVILSTTIFWNYYIKKPLRFIGLKIFLLYLPINSLRFLNNCISPHLVGFSDHLI